jgi:signal transduction histidine kinase
VSNPDDELGRLAKTFNDLLARLESSARQMRGFVADAAHELKTPVSVVRAEAELSLSGDRSLEDSRDALRAIARQSEELSRLVSDLTLLAEGETFDHPLERRLVDLNELAHEVTRSQRALAAGREVVVDVESTGCVEYRGDERLLRQVLKNLVENAIKFSRSPGHVGVSVSEEPRAIEVRVLDEAPTLSAADREKVFERFYRTQQSRSADVPGSGLGLAIARWAVRLHGGEIRVEPRGSAGNVFVVTFPLRAASSVG